MNGSSNGQALTLLLRVILVIAVLGQLVYLAANYRVRADLTADKLYTLTESTERVLGKLEDQLFIDCYFTPDRQLTQSVRDVRTVLSNVLDEYVQHGDGNVVLRYFDPASDTDIQQKAQRLGIKPFQYRSRSGRTMEVRQLWLGLQLRYGGKKRDVIEQIPLSVQGRSADYEALLTPRIKALTLEVKPQIGVIAYSMPPANSGLMGPREPELGFSKLFNLPDLKDHYDFVPVDIREGQLVPDGLDMLMVIRPRRLTDRQKYALDQYLMSGGKLVVFCDVGDYLLGRQRSMRFRDVSYDEAGSKLKFLDQLEIYGVDVREQVVLDTHQLAQVPFGVLVNQAQLTPIPYPYWLRPVDVDWADHARALATGPNGDVDQQLEAQYAAAFERGIAPAVDRTLGTPAMFWPCPVELAALPPGVDGEVIMRTSPKAFAENAPANLSPVGRPDASYPEKELAHRQFEETLRKKLASEPPRQYGLMVKLKGTFRSAFREREVPPRRKPDLDPTPKEPEDPLAGPVGDPLQDPLAGPPAPDGAVVPPAPEVEEPDPVVEADPGAELVVIGDTDFIRDDLIDARYAQLGGPVNHLFGPMFMLGLLDWMAQEKDLFELRSKAITDRTLRFLGDAAANLTPQRQQELRERKTSIVKLVTVGAPIAALMLFGLIVWLRRRATKETFLAEIGG